MQFPIKPTKQHTNGCVSACVQSFIEFLSINFNNHFFIKLKKYSLEEQNPYNIHMLGVAATACEFGLNVFVHSAKSLHGDTLPKNALTKSKLVHKTVISDLEHFEKQNKITLSCGVLNKAEFTDLVKDKLTAGNYVLLLVDSNIWYKHDNHNTSARHVVLIYGFSGNKLSVMDANHKHLTGEYSINHVYKSLNEKQIVVCVAK